MCYIYHRRAFVPAEKMIFCSSCQTKAAQKYRREVQEEINAYHHGAENGRVRAGLCDAGAHRQYRKCTFGTGGEAAGK